MRRSTRWDAEFTEFVEARSPQLYRNAYLLTTSPHAAEDLVQTALAKAYAAWWRVRGASDPVAYVHGILVKAFLWTPAAAGSCRPTECPREPPTTTIRPSGWH